MYGIEHLLTKLWFTCILCLAVDIQCFRVVQKALTFQHTLYVTLKATYLEWQMNFNQEDEFQEMGDTPACLGGFKQSPDLYLLCECGIIT